MRPGSVAAGAAIWAAAAVENWQDALRDDTSEVDVIHFTDPSCPWAYSAEPLMRTLQWRFGDGLRWRTVMIGLSEDTSRAERRATRPSAACRTGSTSSAASACRCSPSRARACCPRAAPAVRSSRRGAQSRELSDALLRRIRLAWFTSTLLLDEDAGSARSRRSCRASTPRQRHRVDRRSRPPRRPTRRIAPRRAAPRREGRPAIAQGRTATSDGPERFTAPSIALPRGRASARGGRLAAARRLRRLHREPRARRCRAVAPPPSPRRSRRSRRASTTAELARVCTEHDDDPDPQAVVARARRRCARRSVGARAARLRRALAARVAPDPHVHVVVVVDELDHHARGPVRPGVRPDERVLHAAPHDPVRPDPARARDRSATRSHTARSVPSRRG